MNIGAYMAVLAQAGKSKEDFASESGIPLSTLYRWLDEEEKKGRVRGINAEGLALLIEGSNHKITAEAVLGIPPRRRRKRAA